MQHRDLDETETAFEFDPRTTPVRNRRRDRGNRTNQRNRAILTSRRGW